MRHDVVVAGGSIAGLLCAREAALGGHSVLVVEQGHEIGTPQHCGGLLSRDALDYLGVVASVRMLGNPIRAARLVAPGGAVVEVASNGRVVEVDRRELDKYVASQAQRAGATIRTGVSFRGESGGVAKTTAGDVPCRVVVDARGVASLGRGPGMMPSVQCEVQAGWIRRGVVSVMVDQMTYPGFFAWVIPSASGRGKVGVAGRGINAGQAMKALLDRLGGGSVFRSIAAPIWVGGPIPEFVQGRVVAVGDAAGQAKPTTGGGIYSGGAGGMLAGRAISRYLDSGRAEDLDYKDAWNAKFGEEFEAQRAARRMLERLDNASIDQLVSRLSPNLISGVADGDFDFHTGAILSLLGVRGTVGAVGAVTASELRRAAGRIRSLIKKSGARVDNA